MNSLPDHLIWHVSTSSNVAAYAHDPATNRLHVRFKNGSVGHYENVSADMHQEFHKAESHGKFLHARLKGNDKHPWHRIEEPVERAHKRGR